VMDTKRRERSTATLTRRKEHLANFIIVDERALILLPDMPRTPGTTIGNYAMVESCYAALLTYAR
jgi:hypothetical protein